MSPALEVVGREAEIDSVHDFLEAVPGGPIALPFAVLGDLLGDVPDAALARLPDPQREALEVALLRAGTKPGGLQRRAVALGVLGAIRVLAEDTPLVLAIDDAQWLDPPSADALAFAARRLRDQPIGFLLARRAEASEESRVELETALESDRLTRLVIGPLDIRSLDRLLRAPAVAVGRPRSRKRQPPESWRSPTAAFGSHIRCSPRSSTRRHRRFGDANCTPAWRRSSTIRTSRRSISPSPRAVPMPRWPRPSTMLPDGQEHVALRKPQRSFGTGHECSRRPMTPTLGDGPSKPGSAISRRGTPTGRDVLSKKWWRASLRVASAPSRSRASRGSPGSGMATTSPPICSAMRSRRSETILRRASRSNGDSHGASTRQVTSRRPRLMRVRRSSSPSVSRSPACSQAHWRTWPSFKPFAGEEFQLRSSSAPSSSKTRKTSGGRSSDAHDRPGSTGCCSSGQAISMLLVRRSLRFATPCSRAATSTPWVTWPTTSVGSSAWPETGSSPGSTPPSASRSPCRPARKNYARSH